MMNDMNKYNRVDKLEWLKTSCSPNFIQNHLALEMANWMGEREFEAFYDTLVRMWDIRREPADPNFDPERDRISE